jgi:hypothetical protein
MFKNKYLLLPILAISVFLHSCGLESMANKFKTVGIVATPTQVEVHGGKVAVELKVEIPEKYFVKNASAKFKAYLAESTTTPTKHFFKTITLQGEQISIDGITIGNASGGKFTYTDEISYDKSMFSHDLFVTAEATIGDKSKDLGSLKIADGVMATSTRVVNDETPAFSAHGYETETILEETATIYFTVNQSNVRYSQKSSEEVAKLKEFANLGYKTKSIEVASYASPEGSLDLNSKVSDDRAKSTFNYAKRLMRQIKIDAYNNDDIYVQSSKGEDWKGFNSLVESSKMKDRSKVLNIVRNNKDPQKREQAIRDMAEIYDALTDDVLPKLRKASIKISSYQPKKTQEDIISLSIEDPTQLSLNEMLYASASIDDVNIKTTIYKTASKMFPMDHRPLNNLASIYIQNKDLSNAKEHLDKANAISSGESEVLENYGVIAAIEGDLEKAQTLYTQAKSQSSNQAILDLRKGNYKSASNSIKGLGHNAVLAKILNGEQSSYTDQTDSQGQYLNAIVAARKNDKAKVISFLTKAISSDASFKADAKEDIEFASYKADVDFLELVK